MGVGSIFIAASHEQEGGAHGLLCTAGVKSVALLAGQAGHLPPGLRSLAWSSIDKYLAWAAVAEPRRSHFHGAKSRRQRCEFGLSQSRWLLHPTSRCGTEDIFAVIRDELATSATDHAVI